MKFNSIEGLFGEKYEIETDETLEKEGIPADAAAVGKELKGLKTNIESLLNPAEEYQYILKTNITKDYFWFWTESAGEKPYKYAYNDYSLVEPITLEAGTYCLSALMIAYSWIITQSTGLKRIDEYEPNSSKATGYFTLTIPETATLYLAYHTPTQVSEVAPYLVNGDKPLKGENYFEGKKEEGFGKFFDYGNFIEAYIKDCELVANELVGDDIGEAKGHYTGVKMDSNIKKVMCKAKLVSNSSVALITTALGSNMVSNITFGSVHLVFGLNSCAVGVFDNKDKLRVIKSIGYTITEGAVVAFGFEINEDTSSLTVYLPNGTSENITDSTITNLNGKYAIWEHFCNTTSGAFACSRITKFYCRDVNGDVLEDDFKRIDGAIGVAPTGQTYRQFTSHNGNSREFK